ncbi:MAG: phosphate ABC transporter, permease protein PstA, partial [Candidatus Omnitrophica bacterium]|nr:phosphate ABC transporter, permease protein PstA [Candidatus Omnitrophota bacterium]
MGKTRLLAMPQLTFQRVRWGEVVSDVFVRFFAVIPLIALGFILYKIVSQGSRAVTWEFLTTAPTDGMMHGGIFPCIFGTVAVTLLMILMALPLGVAAAIYMTEFAGQGFFFRMIRAAVNNLAGV